MPGTLASTNERYARKDLMAALALYEKVLNEGAGAAGVSARQRQAAFYGATACHAAFGDVELAQITLRGERERVWKGRGRGRGGEELCVGGEGVRFVEWRGPQELSSSPVITQTHTHTLQILTYITTNTTQKRASARASTGRRRCATPTPSTSSRRSRC